MVVRWQQPDYRPRAGWDTVCADGLRPAPHGGHCRGEAGQGQQPPQSSDEAASRRRVGVRPMRAYLQLRVQTEGLERPFGFHQSYGDRGGVLEPPAPTRRKRPWSGMGALRYLRVQTAQLSGCAAASEEPVAPRSVCKPWSGRASERRSGVQAARAACLQTYPRSESFASDEVLGATCASRCQSLPALRPERSRQRSWTEPTPAAAEPRRHARSAAVRALRSPSAGAFCCPDALASLSPSAPSPNTSIVLYRCSKTAAMSPKFEQPFKSSLVRPRMPADVLHVGLSGQTPFLKKRGTPGLVGTGRHIVYAAPSGGWLLRHVPIAS